MLSPVQGSTVGSSSATFSWSAGSATQYWLYLGNSAGAKNIYDSGSTTSRSLTVNNIPTDGRTIYVTLWSWVGNKWKSVPYTYTAFH